MRIVIDAWLHYYKTPRFLDSTRDAIKGFNEAHPDYEVRLHEHDYVQMPLEIARAVERGVVPALGQYYSTSSGVAFDMVKNDGSPLYTSVADAIGGRTEILGEPVVDHDVLSHARHYFTAPDGRTGLSPLSSTTLLYANMTLLEAAGITEVPRTWAGIDAACRAVAKLPNPPAHAITWCNHGWMFMQAVAAQGGHLVNRDNGRAGVPDTVHLDSDEMLAFVTWWQRLHKDGYYHYTGTRMDWVGSFGVFAEQQVAFMFTSSVDAHRLVQVGKDRGFVVRASRLPYNDDVPYVGNVLGGDGIFLADGLDEPTRDGALAFLQYLNNPANAIDRHRRTNYMPITYSAVELLREQGWFEEYPHRRVAIDQLEGSDDSPAALGALVGELPRLQDVMTYAMHDVLLSGADPVARFAQANAEGQRLVEDYNAHRGPGRDPGSYRVH
ncbi:extracellular solute-binding protein [Streptosporangium saharense]|uniref:extracellular solute-binding protein n=1 Tax=Streptosporangium saharense TaxID=1706840 RepID=UPI003695DCCA